MFGVFFDLICSSPLPTCVSLLCHVSLELQSSYNRPVRVVRCLYGRVQEFN